MTVKYDGDDDDLYTNHNYFLRKGCGQEVKENTVDINITEKFIELDCHFVINLFLSTRIPSLVEFGQIWWAMFITMGDLPNFAPFPMMPNNIKNGIYQIKVEKQNTLMTFTDKNSVIN